MYRLRLSVDELPVVRIVFLSQSITFSNSLCKTESLEYWQRSSKAPRVVGSFRNVEQDHRCEDYASETCTRLTHWAAACSVHYLRKNGPLSSVHRHTSGCYYSRHRTRLTIIISAHLKLVMIQRKRHIKTTDNLSDRSSSGCCRRLIRIKSHPANFDIRF